MVEIIEIWMPVENGGEAYHWQSKQNLKKVALIANGKPIYLERDFTMEVSHMPEEIFKSKWLSGSKREEGE